MSCVAICFIIFVPPCIIAIFSALQQINSDETGGTFTEQERPTLISHLPSQNNDFTTMPIYKCRHCYTLFRKFQSH